MFEANSRPVPTSSTIHWLNTEANSMASKSVNKSVNGKSDFQKILQIKSETNHEFTFVD
jgi:hypothetical protein